MKIVIGIGKEGLPDETVLRYLRQMQSEIAARAGCVDLESANVIIPVLAIEGVVTAEDCPGDQKVMAVISL